jgi:hypothetical protein
MSTTTLFPLANYPNGTQVADAQPIDDTSGEIQVSVARCTSADNTIWPNTSTTLALTADISMDGGATYSNLFTFSAFGGIQLRKGVEVPQSFVSTSLPPGTNRLGRFTATIAGGPLRSSGTLTLT